MQKAIKMISLILTIALLVIGVSCSDSPSVDDLMSEATTNINALNIPKNVSEEFSPVSLYQSDKQEIVVNYSLNEGAEAYLAIEDNTLKYVSLPTTGSFTAILTADITVTVGDDSKTNSISFDIIMAKPIDPSLPIYQVNVTGINGRKITGALVIFTLDGNKVAEGETTDGVFEANIEANVYDVAIYSTTGFVFGDGSDLYETKTDRNATPINVECIPTLINEEAPANYTYSTGDQMYDFTVETYNPLSQTWGNTWTLSEKLAENELVIINFWYSDCSWCQKEFPVLIDTYQDFIEQGFDLTILGVTYTGADNEDSVKLAAATYGINFELAIADELVSQFKVTGFPTTVFIDRYATADYIESGAITQASRWANVFQGYLGADYNPTYKGDGSGGVEQIVPDVPFPESSVLENVLNQGDFTATYKPETIEPDATYSWPFIPSSANDTVIPANTGIDNSYSIMYMDVELQAGQAFAFDYMASTEEDLDILYLIHDGVILGQFSGIDDDFTTFYPFVADEAGVYTFSFIYMKDQMASDGEDTVYLKNFRYVDSNSIPEPLFVIRESSKNQDVLEGGYLDYITAVYNAEDGYYHVNDINGPLLLADLMSATHFSNDTLLSYAESLQFEGSVDGVSINDLIIRYAQYAANSLTQGYTPVTEELKAVLETIAQELGTNSEVHAKDEWLEMTVYYEVYGNTLGDVRVDQETGQIIDPTIGLAHHNAIKVEVSDISSSLNPDGSIKDDTSDVVAGVVEYTMDRFITTRGFYFEFVPEYSGVYLVYGLTGNSTDCYIENIGYEIVSQANFEIRDYYRWADMGQEVSDYYLYSYLEAGQTYYIVPFYTNYGDFGNVNFKINYLGKEYVVLEKASSFAYTTSSDFTEGDTSDIEDIIISIGIDVVLDENGYYHQLYSDGSYSKDYIYFDLVYSNMLINMTFEDALLKYPSTFDMTLSDYGDSIIDEEGYLQERTYTLNTETGETIKEAHRVLDENNQPIKASDYSYLYRDWSSDVKSWISDSMITDQNNTAYGCIPVTEDVKTLLELLMNKYSFKDVEGSWLKLCYYYKYYGATEHSADVVLP